MQRKLQLTEELEAYNRDRIMEHLAEKNREQQSLQDQQTNYVNNAASNKRRGFSAVLGGTSSTRGRPAAKTLGSHGPGTTKRFLNPSSSLNPSQMIKNNLVDRKTRLI